MCILIYIVQKKPTYLIVSSLPTPSTSNNQAWQCPKPKVVYHPRRLAEIGHFRFVILSLGFFSRTKTCSIPKKDPKLAVEKHLL